LEWVKKYLAEARPALLQGKLTDTLFVTFRGEGMTRQMSPHTLRHAPDQPRRRPARGAEAAGAF
jgi:integrase/recombinase XerD